MGFLTENVFSGPTINILSISPDEKSSMAKDIALAQFVWFEILKFLSRLCSCFRKIFRTLFHHNYYVILKYNRLSARCITRYIIEGRARGNAKTLEINATHKVHHSKLFISTSKICAKQIVFARIGTSDLCSTLQYMNEVNIPISSTYTFPLPVLTLHEKCSRLVEIALYRFVLFETLTVHFSI